MLTVLSCRQRHGETNLASGGRRKYLVDSDYVLPLCSLGQMRKTSSGLVPIIQLDRRAREPLHRQIYNGYRTAILERRLRPNERVPSTRTLALELGVSRIPVLNAYAQLLAEGYFQARIGAGTIVSSMLPDQIVRPQRSSSGAQLRGPRARSSNGVPLPPLESILPWLKERWGAFSTGQPALDHFPLKIWSRLVSRQCRDLPLESLQYGDPMGLPYLREVIAAYLRTARSLRCEADQIMIVSGSQQALELLPGFYLIEGAGYGWKSPGIDLHATSSIKTAAGLFRLP